MKKLILALLFGVGMLAVSQKASAGDWDGIAYEVSAASSVFVSSSMPIELIDLSWSAGTDNKYIVVIDSNPLTMEKSTTGSYPAPTTFPKNQWATAGYTINSATGSLSGQAGNYINLRGTIIKNGLSVVMSAVGTDTYANTTTWCLRFRRKQ